MKIDLIVEDEDTERVWRFIEESRSLIESWPVWKRAPWQRATPGCAVPERTDHEQTTQHLDSTH